MGRAKPETRGHDRRLFQILETNDGDAEKSAGREEVKRWMATLGSRIHMLELLCVCVERGRRQPRG